VAFVIAHILIIFPMGGIDYNTLLVMNLVLAIGFAVDYCAHIGQHFANHPHLSPKARALNAINTMAGSVLKAGFSTILAVSCLVFSRGLVTSTLLKCFVVMVITGLLHALVFMPCTLFLLATFYERVFPSKKSDPEIQLTSGEEAEAL
jgi:predicted RND superfamily exporter protein